MDKPFQDEARFVAAIYSPALSLPVAVKCGIYSTVTRKNHIDIDELQVEGITRAANTPRELIDALYASCIKRCGTIDIKVNDIYIYRTVNVTQEKDNRRLLIPEWYSDKITMDATAYVRKLLNNMN